MNYLVQTNSTSRLSDFGLSKGIPTQTHILKFYIPLMKIFPIFFDTLPIFSNFPEVLT